MNDTANRTQCEQAATRLVTQAAWPAGVIIATGVLLPLWLSTQNLTFPAGLLLSMAAAAGFAALGLSGLLLFDAVLFRLMASYDDEAAGGKAVDEILQRMRLKPMPAEVRTLASRLAGTGRLLMAQRVAFAIFTAATLACIATIGSKAA